MSLVTSAERIIACINTCTCEESLASLLNQWGQGADAVSTHGGKGMMRRQRSDRQALGLLLMIPQCLNVMLAHFRQQCGTLTRI